MWRKKEIWGLAVGLIMGLLVTSPLTAKGLTVAVFNFESEDVTPSDIGSKISDSHLSDFVYSVFITHFFDPRYFCSDFWIVPEFSLTISSNHVVCRSI